MTMNRTYYPIGHSCQRGVAVADFILCEFFVSAAQILVSEAQSLISDAQA